MERRGAGAGRLDLAYITFITYITYITIRPGKKNPELWARGREADFLKGSKAR